MPTPSLAHGAGPPPCPGPTAGALDGTGADGVGAVGVGLIHADAVGVGGGPPTGVDGRNQGWATAPTTPVATMPATTRAVAVRRARRRRRVCRTASTPGGAILGSVVVR